MQACGFVVPLCCQLSNQFQLTFGALGNNKGKSCKRARRSDIWDISVKPQEREPAPENAEGWEILQEHRCLFRPQVQCKKIGGIKENKKTVKFSKTNLYLFTGQHLTGKSSNWKWKEGVQSVQVPVCYGTATTDTLMALLIFFKDPFPPHMSCDSLKIMCQVLQMSSLKSVFRNSAVDLWYFMLPHFWC